MDGTGNMAKKGFCEVRLLFDNKWRLMNTVYKPKNIFQNMYLFDLKKLIDVKRCLYQYLIIIRKYSDIVCYNEKAYFC